MPPCMKRHILFVSLLLCASAAYALEILVANDDGVEAPGIEILASALREAGHAVTIVAPRLDQSGTSARITTTPFRFREEGPGRFVVDGSPADAVWAGLSEIYGDDPPDLVISGVNRGQNLGAVTHLSGTVGAALMATLNGVPAIAVSAGMDFTEAEAGFPSTRAASAEAAALVVRVVAELVARAGDGPLLPAGSLLNINQPIARGAQRPAAVWAHPGRGWGYAAHYRAEAIPDTLKLGFGPDPGPYRADDMTDTARFARGSATVSLLFAGWGAGSPAAEAEVRERLSEIVAP